MKRKEKQKLLQRSLFNSMSFEDRQATMENLLFSICAKVYEETGLEPSVFYSACLTFIELFDKAPHDIDSAPDLIIWLSSELNMLNAEKSYFSVDI